MTFTPGKAFHSYNPNQTRNPYPAGSREAQQWAGDRRVYQSRLRDYQATQNNAVPSDRRADRGAVNPYAPSTTDPTLAADPALGASTYTPGQVQVDNVYSGWEAFADAEGGYKYQARNTGAEQAARQEYDNKIAGEKAAWDERENARERNWNNWQSQLRANWEERENANAYDYEKKHGKDYAARNPYQRQVYAGESYARNAYTPSESYADKPIYQDSFNVGVDEDGMQKLWELPGGKSKNAYYDEIRKRENRSLYSRSA